ncbi:SCO family protein [Sphingomonas sp. JC676]|uniref:SCO family protein n=1 Tax=Sphingomonas sp. JC676 TaxID=2768065 RepID=UPI00223C462C|nr:SCO family protein [Sphingomonas sp. JC676]
MNRMFPALTLLLSASSLAGCGQPQQPPLAGATIGGPFALTDQNGKTVRDTDFAGKYRIVYFGYTYCPDVCPTDMQKIGQAMRILDKSDPRTSDKIVPIFISVDPERDTPPVLKQFVANFHPRIIGLTGSPDAIAKVAKSYAVYFKKQPVSAGGGYMVDHLAIAFLMDPQGKPMVSLPIDKDGEAVAADLRRWVQ